MNLTKKANEAQERLDKVGTDGVLPLSQEHQAAHDRTEELRRQISNLELVPGEDSKASIATRQKEIKELKKKLPVQASQLMRDQSLLHGTLAEIEEKGEVEEQRLKDKYEKLLNTGNPLFRRATRTRRTSRN